MDPDGWGDAGSINDFFTDDAKTTGRRQHRHPHARQERVRHGRHVHAAKKGNVIKVTSLIDSNLNVIRANAEFTFKGTTANTDGTTSKVTVTGTLFFVPDGNDWKIEAFHINREEKPHKAPSASASASGATS